MSDEKTTEQLLAELTPEQVLALRRQHGPKGVLGEIRVEGEIVIRGPDGKVKSRGRIFEIDEESDDATIGRNARSSS